MVRSARRVAMAGLAWFGLGADPAAAAPEIVSNAYAEANESGDEDPGSDVDGETALTAGETASAHAFRCPGLATCAFPPADVHGANASATTTYGSNRASMSAESGRDLDAENEVFDRANASSYYVDDWTFSVAPGAAGKSVALEFRLDGSWANGAFVEFEAGVFDLSIAPEPPNPEDPPPFLPVIDGTQLAFVHFQNDQDFVVAGPPVALISVPAGGDSSGSMDVVAVIQFVPTAGTTYAIASRLLVKGGGDLESDVAANFDSTAALTRVLLPGGISFASAAGASWNVEVPEPALVGLGAASVIPWAWRTLSRRRSRT